MNKFLIKCRFPIHSSINDALLGYEDYKEIVLENEVGNKVVGFLAGNAEKLTVESYNGPDKVSIATQVH